MTGGQWDPARERVRIAQDLTAIEDMFARLGQEAINRAGDPEIPGGAAMVLLGPGADLEAFGYAQMSELMGRTSGRTELALRSDVEPPLSFLASWSDIVRAERGQEPSKQEPGVAAEVKFLRSVLDWMLSDNGDGEPVFIQVEDFSNQLHRVRRAMESVLRDGDHPDRINARCRECDARPRLEVNPGARFFKWRCPACHAEYDDRGVANCWHAMIAERQDEMPTWVTMQVAAAATGRPYRTLQTWARQRWRNGKPVAPRVATWDTTDGKRMLWWDDVWREHERAEQRRERRALGMTA